MKLWGARFGEAPEQAAWDFTVSRADRRLLEVDIEGSLAHVAGLAVAGILDRETCNALTAGLEAVLAEAREGTFGWLDTDEDVHTAVERRLGEIAGAAVAGRLHTGRSRNDQIALDLRLYLARAARLRITGITGLVATLAAKAGEVEGVVVPSYTHLQQAQAIPLGHHLLAHAWALLRDVGRFTDALVRIEVSPLGAGAGGGSRLPLDPSVAAGRLGFGAVFENSLDAVASRDVVSEYVFCAAQCLVHLSRLAEEIVLWASFEFRWATFADRHTTGSSALPHKKNPDVAELARGKAATAVGDLAGILALQKGLPLAYNRDLQQDKEHLFRVDDDLAGALAALTPMMADAVFAPPPPLPWVTALDLAEVLVERGVPFREAHEVVGRIVADLVAHGRDPSDLGADELAAADSRFLPEDITALSPETSVERRRSPGGGSNASVAAQLDAIEARLRNLRTG